MSYIGQGLPADVFSGYVTDTFTGDGSATTFTLSKEPFSEDSLIVVVDNVIQQPTTNFTVSGTTLTIVGTAILSGIKGYAIHVGGPLAIGQAASLDLNGASDKLILDLDADTTISADTDDQIDIKVGDADILNITNSSSDAVITQGVQDKDILFKGNDGGSAVTALTLDMSDAGAATLNNGLTLTDGNITFAGSGHGIHLGVTSANAANLLHDYEEGTWTVDLQDSSGNNVTLNGSINTGSYVKVGNIVHVSGYIVATSLGSASGDLQINGLPFSIPGSYHFYSTLSVGYAAGLAIGSGTSIQGFAVINTSHVQLTNFDATTGTTHMQASELSADGSMIFQLTYAVA